MSIVALMDRRYLAAALAASISVIGLFLCADPAASAATVTYTLDPSRSVLTVSGAYAGQVVQTMKYVSADTNAVLATGLSTSYAGTITANRDTNANTLQITGGNIAAQFNGFISYSTGDPDAPLLNNYVFFIDPFGPPPSALEAYPAWGPSSYQFWAAIGNFSFSPVSSTISDPADFDASQISATVSSGQFEGAIVTINPLPSGMGDTSSAFSAVIPQNLTFASGGASLEDADGVETLSVSVSTDLAIPVNGQTLNLSFSGDIIASALVPEPSSLALVVTSALLLQRRRRVIPAAITPQSANV
jgi:hypothetical protein